MADIDGYAVILTDDCVFGRMLVLELERIGISGEIIQADTWPELEQKLFGKTLFLCDYDYASRQFSDAELIRLKALEILSLMYSYHMPADLPDRRNHWAAECFRRPFAVSEFLEYIQNSLKAGRQGNRYRLTGEREEREEKKEKEAHTASAASSEILSFCGNGQDILYCGKTIRLTKREYDLLEYLYANRSKVVTRDEAVKNVWKYDYTGNTNVVDVYIRYLREKLERAGNIKLIYTIRNTGYMIK